jgi:4-diphosphocytidyl-2-C-methyl-D-erythritol kinase
MLTLHAPAKINWFLLVLGKRKDGYHDIQSLVQCVSLHDVLSFEEAGSVEVATDATIAEKENLVYRAAVLLKDAAGIKKGARITLRKEIPLAAGLGGGSSDAACTLRGLCRLWDINMPEDGLFEIAASLGSDVPFFMGSAPALVGGRGENVTPVELRRKWSLLLVKPPVGVSAGWAYSGTGEPSKTALDAGLFTRALDSADMAALRAMMRNDLETPVLKRYPEVEKIKKSLIENSALASLMSGSGPTVFGLFEDRAGAERASRAFKHHWSAVVETIG